MNIFGFSYSIPQLKTRAGHATQPHRQFGGHSWSYDAALLRLLALVYNEDVAICTADDSTIPTGQLRKRSNKIHDEIGKEVEVELTLA